MTITAEIYDVAAAPTSGSNTVEDRITSAELYLVDPECLDLDPSDWELVKAAIAEQEYLVLFRDATSPHEIRLRRTDDGEPIGQGTRISSYEVRRVLVRPGWSVYVRAA